MRHSVDGRKLGRNTSHRKALFRNMANAVIVQEQIVTTVQKAKEIRRVVDRLVTLGKSGSAASRRLAFDRTRDNEVVGKLFTTLAERYKSRAGGYTRVLRLSERRWGDSAEMAILELVDHPVLDRKKKVKAEVDAEGGSDVAGATPKAAPAPQDPLARVRKVFAGKSKVSGKSGKGAQGAAKSASTSRKIPSGGKQGGSSS